MFQSLRQNSQIYIFYKGNKPSLNIGSVVNVSMPKPKYPITQTFGQSQEMVIDIIAKVNDVIVNYNSLPATLDIADSYSNGESIVIADSREAINSEILNYKQKSLDIINSIDIHKNIIQDCDDILNKVNPEYAEKKQQQDEILTLRNQISEMSLNLTNLTQMIEQLKSNNYEQNVGNQGT